MISHTHLSKPEEYTRSVNPKVNCGHWVMNMYQWRFISCNICTTLVGALIKEETIHGWGQIVYGKISIPCTQFH